MRIAVLFTKAEDEIEGCHLDWEGRNTNEDAESVIKAIEALGHEAKVYHVDIGLFEKLKRDKESIGLAFNLCDDGFFSNSQLEPHLPAMLDILKMPYTGSDYLSLALSLNKARAKRLLAYYNIPSPRFQVFREGKEKIGPALNFPLIVKPVKEDASVGIKDESIVRCDEELRDRVEIIIKEYKQPALAEEFIDGREFSVGIIGDEEKEVLSISETTFEFPEGKPRIVSYSAKWDSESMEYKGTKENYSPYISKTLKEKLTSLALLSSEVMLCRDYFRVDFRVDKSENPFVLDVNPNPSISECAGLAVMAESKGYSYNMLIDKIIKSALKRKAGSLNINVY
ncbi:ATP-grasp domain-containing protein [Candidatus Woesearchaeota archaeon]|nr:ATP-grasp domain-containing protein [Candidatus Woesearchaeota archaeon]